MDKSLAGVIGAVTALAAAAPLQAANAAPPTMDAAMQASSYADLLNPIPNALALLKASGAAETQGTEGAASESEATVQQVQYHHHHHHHHRYFRRRRYHHHHHHHAYYGNPYYREGFVRGIPPYSA